MKLLTRLPLLIFVLLLAAKSHAAAATPTPVSQSDTFGYQLNSIPYVWNDISATGTTITAWTNGADDGFFQLSMPFTFRFYGNPYTKVSIATNGYLQFGTTSSFSGNDPLTNPSISPQNIAALLWQDLDLSAGGNIYYEIQGSAPNRMAVIQYDNVPLFSVSPPGPPVSFQARLYESSDRIEIFYADTINAGEGNTASTGLRSLNDCPNRTSLPHVYLQPQLPAGLGLRYTAPAPVPACGTPTFSPSPSITQTETISPSATPSATITLSHTMSPTFSVTPTASPSFSASATFTVSPTHSPTPTASKTSTASYTVSPTVSNTPIDTAIPSASVTSTPSPSFSPTALARSDSYGYQLSTQVFNWNDISTTGTAITTWTNGPDDGWFQLALPYTFTFYGNPYSKVSIATNGYLQFGTVSSFNGNDPLNTNISPNNIVALYWEDLTLASSGEVFYQIQGSAPNRVTLIQYSAVPRFSGGGNITLQARLFENGHHLEVDYLSVASAGAGSGAAAGLRSLYDCANRSSLPWVFQSAEISNLLSLRYSNPVPPPACGTLTVTATHTPSSSMTPSATLTQTSTPSFSQTSSQTTTPSITPSYSFTITQTHTNSPTNTFSPSVTLTSTISPTFSVSPTFSASPTITPTFSITKTFTNSPSATPTATISPSFTASPTITVTASHSPTSSHSPTKTSTSTATFSFTVSPSVTATATISTTFSASPSLTVTPTASQTSSGTVTPSSSPTVTATHSPTVTQSFTASPTATRSSTRTVTSTRTLTPYPPAAIPACLVLGQQNFTSALTGSTSAAALNSPSAVAVDTRIQPYRIYVSDAGHNRILIYSNAEALANGLPADGVIGQINFTSSTANRGGSVSASTLSNPAGMVIAGDGSLWVADTGNHRVLRFPYPTLLGAAADLVLGQSGSFSSNSPNLGGVGANSLNAPTALALGFYDGFSTELYVADTGNHRVLRFNNPVFPTASTVFGQSGSFSSDIPNLGGISASSLNAPRGLAWEFGNLFIADSGNHRVLRYSVNPPVTNAVGVLGQVDFSSNSANRGLTNPDSSSLSSPVGLALDPGKRLYVSDSGNHRVLGFWPWDLSYANNVWGQIGLGVGSPGLADNRMNTPLSIAIPDGLSLVVVDSGNHRVTIYECSESLRASTVTLTYTLTPSVTNSPTQSPSFTNSSTLTGTLTITSTITTSATPSVTLTPNPLNTATATPSITQSFTPSYTFSPSATPSRSPTFTITPTFSKTFTTIPSQTPYPLLSNRTLAYPNPVSRTRGRHCIAFPASKNTDIWIHNLLGERLYQFESGEINAAQGWACWSLRTTGGSLLAPGIYYYRAQVDGKNYVGKFTVR